MRSNRKHRGFRTVALLTISLFLCACERHDDVEYPGNDSLAKGEDPIVPIEFRNGTATMKQAENWLRSESFDIDATHNRIHSEPFNLLPNGRPVFFLWDSSLSGNNQTGLVLEQTPTGIRYLGFLQMQWCRSIDPDAQGHPRLVTVQHLGANDAYVELFALTDQGFEIIQSVSVHYDDDGDPKSRDAARALNALRETSHISETLVTPFFKLPTAAVLRPAAR